MYKYSNELNGSLEDIKISDITPSIHELRSNLLDLDELASSIKKIGLLQPIVVRTNSSDSFEVVAGNRRLKACKKLGLRKIVCHVVELDDKTAFEVSIIENVQRRTLSPIEEGLAFRRYVIEFGWGGVSELAEKLSKSTSYVSKRIKFTQLPEDIIDLISNHEVNVSAVQEIFPIRDKDIQSKLTQLIKHKQLSAITVRKIVKELGTEKSDKDSLHNFTIENDHDRIYKSFDKAIISLKILIKKFATIIQNIEDKWIFYDIFMQHKHMLHRQIDLLIKEKRKYRKRSNLLLACH